MVAFRDDRKLNKGEPISAELLQAIEESRVLIVVFSKNYATSTWCLQELEKIVDCIEVPGRSVLPIFYDVSPSEVRKQSGDYENAFAVHETRFKEDLEKVRRWRAALVQVTNLCGWDVRNKPQNGEIEKIVEEVISILGYKFSSPTDDIVGMHSRVEQLKKLLVLDSDDDVRVVGICGMGGIGKTTVARFLYDSISHQYGACCFIDDLSKIYGDYGPIGAQKQLLCQTLNEEIQEICNLSKANHLIRTRLRHVRALIVLDNVDQVEQLEKLAVNRECLAAGSRIVIISRDEHILRVYGVDEVYNVQLLNWDKAIQLFCRKAFKCDDIMRDYEELTYRALEYANGLPLAIKVLGSHLFGRDIGVWRSALARLRENPRKEIMHVLRISFDGLEQTEKEIFLDIACFFNHRHEGYVRQVLDCCGFHPDIGIRVLIDKSLITTSGLWITMHDMLQELGMKIVREKAPKEPRKWSRLWLYEDLHNVMLEKTAIENLEAIKVIGENSTLRAEGLSKMSRLRLLILGRQSFSGSLNCLSNELRYLKWDNYPFTSLPSSFEPDKLVELILRSSSIKQLWEGIKLLPNLRNMELSCSEKLMKTPDFSGVPNLQRLDLHGCTKLVQINPSIGLLRKLVYLNLSACTSLMSLPNNILSLDSLEVLILSRCSKLFNNPLLEKGRQGEHLKKLDISGTSIQCQSISSVCKRLMVPFHFFNSRRHKDLLLPSLHRFPCLRDLDLSFSNLVKIPDAIVLLQCLERLNLRGNNFVTLPSSIKELPRLISLNLEHCKQLKYLYELPSCTTTVLPDTRELDFYEYGAGLFIFNCPKLVEMESWSSMALSWMIQVLQVHRKLSFPKIDIIIPGTQIPRWFNNQSVGDSIRIESFPNIVRDSNWIGVAFCVAFVVHAHDHPTYLSEGQRPFGCIGYSVVYNGRKLNRNIELLTETDLVTVELDHLFVHYFKREEFLGPICWSTDEMHDLDDIKLETFIRDPRGLSLEVKNCGMRAVFKQDFEELNPTMINNDLQIE